MAIPYSGAPAAPGGGGLVGQDYTNPQVQKPMTSETFQQNAYSDPKYLAWLRAQGASDDVARAEAAQAIGSARTGQNNLPGEYADMLGQSLRKISDQFEDHGAWNSSARLRAQNESQGALEGQMTGQRNAFQDQINSANIGLSKQLAMGQMQNAEQQGAAADRTLLEGAQYGVNPFMGSAKLAPTGPQTGPR